MLTRACAAMRTAAGGSGSAQLASREARPGEALGSPVQPLDNKPVAGSPCTRCAWMALPVGTFDWPRRRAKSPRGACSWAYVLWARLRGVCPRVVRWGTRGFFAQLAAGMTRRVTSSSPRTQLSLVGPEFRKSSLARPTGAASCISTGRRGCAGESKGARGPAVGQVDLSKGADCAS